MNTFLPQKFGYVDKNDYLCTWSSWTGFYMDDREQYINFDEYIRQGESQKRERADAWRVAIGLN